MKKNEINKIHSDFFSALNKKPDDLPAFKAGQIVKIKGSKGTHLLPDIAFWIDYASKNKSSYGYNEMSDQEFAEMRMKQCCSAVGCMSCATSGYPCWEYYLVEIDQTGTPTGEISTHVCERLLKLKK